MNPAIALALKDLKLLARSPANLFFTFAFPLILALFFGAVFGGNGDNGSKLDVALVNLDGGPASEELAKDAAADDSLNIHTAGTRAEGEDLVRKGDVVACVIIPEGFEAAAGGMFSGKTQELEAIVDPTRSAEAGLLTGKLNELAFRQMPRMFSDPSRMSKALDQARTSINGTADLKPSEKLLFNTFFGAAETLTKGMNERETDTVNPSSDNPMASWRPVNVTVKQLERKGGIPNNRFAISFPQGIVWGLLGAVMAFGVSVAEERSRGTLMRLTTAPIHPSAIIAGKAIACFATCLIVQALLLAMAVGVLGVRVSSPLMMLVAAMASALGFTGVMMAIAGLFRSEAAANGAGRVIMLVLAMIGGGSLPLFMLPPWAAAASCISPFRWTTLATEGALWRDFSVTDMALPVGVLLAFAVGGFLVGAWGMKRARAA